MIRLKMTREQARKTWYISACHGLCPGTIMAGESSYESDTRGGACYHSNNNNCEQCRNNFLDKYTVEEVEE